MNALSSVARCLEWRHLKIRLALVRAFLTTVQICCDIVSFLSIKNVQVPYFGNTTDAGLLNYITLVDVDLTKA